MIKEQRSKRLFAGAGAFGLLLLFLLNTAEVAEGCFAALETFAHGVLPATFPYLLLSEIILSTDFAGALGRRCGKTLGRLFALPPAAVSALLMGMISGFPIGGKMAADLYTAGSIDKTDAERLAAFADFCGPPFLLLNVGSRLFGDIRIGALLYVCQSITALAFGAIYRRKSGKNSRDLPRIPLKKPLSRIFTDAVSGAALSVLRILGYLLFFAALCRIGSKTLSLLLPNNSPANPILQILLSGFLEISAGCSALNTLSSPTFTLIVAALLTGWSGLSVALQISGFLKEAGLSMKGYLFAHLLCPPINAFSAVLVGKLLGLL